MNYRHLSKQKTLAFGVYPDTGLAAAREILVRGDDPAKQIKLEKIAAAREKIAACETSASKSRKAVRCTISIGVPN